MLWMHEELDRGYRTKQLHEEFYVLFFLSFLRLEERRVLYCYHEYEDTDLKGTDQYASVEVLLHLSKGKRVHGGLIGETEDVVVETSQTKLFLERR